MDRTPFELFFHLKTKPQLIFFGINLRIWARRFTRTSSLFVSHKIEQDLKLREVKPPVVNQQCLVYKFKCELCDAGYVGFTRRHLHQGVDEHKGPSLICKHYCEKHLLVPKDLSKNFTVLKKCTNKFDCLVYEILLHSRLINGEEVSMYNRNGAAGRWITVLVCRGACLSRMDDNTEPYWSDSSVSKIQWEGSELLMNGTTYRSNDPEVTFPTFESSND